MEHMPEAANAIPIALPVFTLTLLPTDVQVHAQMEDTQIQQLTNVSPNVLPAIIWIVHHSAQLAVLEVISLIIQPGSVEPCVRLAIGDTTSFVSSFAPRTILEI
jgi:hypothetical protein